MLVSAQQDPDALAEGNHGLLVRGRGSDHQADVLGELTLPTPFSLPLRIFVEAKYRRATTGLAAVRNAHGVVHDVNEHYSTAHHGRLRLPVRRHLYRYALFSTSGFTRHAQQYALAQQVFLVDLSGQAFKGLRGGVEEAARQLHELAAATGGPFPRGQVRTALRLSLGTWTAERIPPEETTIDVLGRESSARNPALAEDRELSPRRLAGIADSLASRVGDSLLLGFPSAPFVLVFRPDDLADFGAYIAEHGTDIDVRITRRDVSSDWAVVPADGTRAFRLPFSLPALL